MIKRIVATALWFLAGCYGTAVLAQLVGFDSVLAPFVGVAGAAFVAIDPLRLFWPRAASAQSASRPDSTLAGDGI
jgi:hypothetical protein